tara:strand:- start:42 stop:518 length:477 start_codon:yes stop_codon:yes gene_type:complete
MEDNRGKKNRDFLKKFVSKDVVKEKGAYWLEEVKTEDPEEWKILERKKKNKSHKAPNKKKKKTKKVRHIPIPNLHKNYQEKAYQNISGGKQNEELTSNLASFPSPKKKLYDSDKVKPESCKYCSKGFKNKEEKELHEKEHLMKEKLTKERTARTYKGA